MIFFERIAATQPVPLGAGIILTVTDPHFPLTFAGIVWTLPILEPQYPLLTGIILSFASISAPLIAI
ncbi:MAG: hypothetical protein ACKO96_36755 [Flammeovirgaceae bacterium]